MKLVHVALVFGALIANSPVMAQATTPDGRPIDPDGIEGKDKKS